MALRQRTKSDVLYLNVEEQKEVIKKLESENNRTNRIFRAIFIFFSLFCGFSKLFAIASHYYSPWSIDAHALVSDRVPPTVILSTEFLSSICYMYSGYFIWKKIRRSIYFPISMIAAGVPLCGWFYFWNPRILPSLWFLGGNVIFSVVCTYVHSIMEDTEQKVMKLYDSTYPYKKV
eukprot:TRINITY_DN3426_c0_g1_i1.p1 TRINITY_DN3426_c0_g1~~TRINITY_DN3426_c0_g1_i1.p1  ORF type:complete len:176 (-),score=13.04 TRINITY_DN3426_c0_g1_i1:31-558(-)